MMNTLLTRYVRLLRAVWLHPSVAELQAAIHAFEREHPDLVEMSKTIEPLLVGEELSEALKNLDYFARAAPDRWQRTTKTKEEAQKFLEAMW